MAKEIDAETEAAIERQRIEWVFGLTGGELSDEPWVFWTQAESEVDGRPLFDKDKPDHADWFVSWSCSYWYEGEPDYVEKRQDDDFWPTYRTIVQPGGMLSAPHRELYDGDGVWKLVETYSSSGETECPWRHADDPRDRYVAGLCPICGVRVLLVDQGADKDGEPIPKFTLDGRLIGACGDAFTEKQWTEDRDECPLCEEPAGNRHGYIYLGDGGYEAVYVLEEQHTYTVEVGNIGTVYRGQDRAEAERTFKEYVEQSDTLEGARAYGENVYLMVSGGNLDDILKEHEGALSRGPGDGIDD